MNREYTRWFMKELVSMMHCCKYRTLPYLLKKYAIQRVPAARSHPHDSSALFPYWKHMIAPIHLLDLMLDSHVCMHGLILVVMLKEIFGLPKTTKLL